MLILRHVGQTFRERSPEWIMAGLTACWGGNALVDTFRLTTRHTMDSPFYAPLLSVMPQMGWGIYALAVGLTRLLFLCINGSRPRGSTLLRTIGAVCSATFWFGLVIGALALPWASSAVYTYSALLLFDTIALWYAGGEIYGAFSRSDPVRGLA